MHRPAQARRRPQGHDGPGRHAPRRRDRAAAALGAAAPSQPIVFGPSTEPPRFPATPDQVRPLQRRPVACGTCEGRLWNEFVARYRHVGQKTLAGARLRYAVHDRHGPARRGARLQHCRMEARSPGRLHRLDPATAREKPLVVDNPRFLILPWINIPNSGSRILAIVRGLPRDWAKHDHTAPVFIESFVSRALHSRDSFLLRLGNLGGQRVNRHGVLGGTGVPPPSRCSPLVAKPDVSPVDRPPRSGQRPPFRRRPEPRLSSLLKRNALGRNRTRQVSRKTVESLSGEGTESVHLALDCVAVEVSNQRHLGRELCHGVIRGVEPDRVAPPYNHLSRRILTFPDTVVSIVCFATRGSETVLDRCLGGDKV